MVITDIKRKGKSEIYKVFVNDEFFSLFEGEVIVKNHIKIGVEYDSEKLNTFKNESDIIVCYEMALNYVSKSIKTKLQVKTYLKKYKFGNEIIDSSIKKLEDYGYINDGYYANLVVGSMSNNRGKRYIKNQLMLKGVSEQNINCALENIENEDETCKNVATKWLKGKPLPLDKKNKEKLYRFLLCRGFEYETIKRVMNNKNIFGEEDGWNWFNWGWKN